MKGAVRILLALSLGIALIGLAWWFLVRDEPGDVPTAGARLSDSGRAEARASSALTDVDRAPEPAEQAAAGERVAEGLGTVLLFGHVVDPAGVRIEDATVYLGPFPNAFDINPPRQEGSYSAPGLAPGIWRVNITAQGFRRLYGDLEVPAEPAQQRVDFILKPTIPLEVFLHSPDGGPLREALREDTDWRGRRSWGTGIAVVARTEPFPDRFAMDRHGSHAGTSVGRFEWADTREADTAADPGSVLLPDGVLHLEADPPLHVGLTFKHVVLASTLVPAGATEVHLSADPGAVKQARSKVTVRVIEAEGGGPVSTEYVRVGGGGGRYTDESGTVTFESVDPGLIGLVIESEVHGWVNEYIWVEAGQDVQQVVELAPAVVLRGRLETEDGRRIPRGAVSYRDLDRLAGPPQPLSLNSFYLVGATGLFVIHYAGLRRYLFWPEDTEERWAINPTVIDARELAGGEAVVRLARGTRVDLEMAVPKGEHYLYRVLDEVGVPVWCDLIRETWVRDLLLRPGRYTVETFRNTERLREVSFDVGETPMSLSVHPREDSPPGPVRPTWLPEDSVVRGGLAVVQAEQGEAYTLQGLVRDTKGNEIAPSSVELRATDGSRTRPSRNGPRFSAVGVASGTYTLSVTAEGHRRHEQTLEVAAETELEVTLTPALCFDLWFESPDGKLLYEDADRELRSRMSSGRPSVLVAAAPAAASDRQDRTYASVESEFGGFFSRYRVELYHELPACVTVSFEEQVLLTHWIEEPTGEVVIRIPLSLFDVQTCEVLLRVTDGHTGETIEPSMVSLVRRGGQPGTHKTDHKSSGGTIRLTRQAPGKRALHVRHEGYAPLEQDVELEPGGVHDLGMLELHPLVWLRGRVEDSSGDPLQCKLIYRDRDAELNPYHTTYAASTDDGRLAIQLPRGRYVLLLDEPRFANQVVEVDLTEGAVEDVLVVAERGTRVTFALDSGETARTRIILESDGVELFRQDLAPDEPFHVRLLPGLYTLRVLGGSKELRADPLTIGASDQQVAVYR